MFLCPEISSTKLFYFVSVLMARKLKRESLTASYSIHGEIRRCRKDLSFSHSCGHSCEEPILPRPSHCAFWPCSFQRRISPEFLRYIYSGKRFFIPKFFVRPEFRTFCWNCRATNKRFLAIAFPDFWKLGHFHCPCQSHKIMNLRNTEEKVLKQYIVRSTTAVSIHGLRPKRHSVNAVTQHERKRTQNTHKVNLYFPNASLPSKARKEYAHCVAVSFP